MIFMDKKYTKQRNGRILTVMLFLLLSVAGIGFSVYLFYVANSIYMYVLAVLFLLLSIVAGLFNVHASVWYYRSFKYEEYLERIKKTLKPLTKLPTVTVAIPAYNEDPKMVDDNVKELLQINYPKDKLDVYLLDDSTNQEIAKGLRTVAKKYKIHYIHRDERKGYKAGALNNLLKHSKGEFLAVFDSDEKIIDRNFLMDLLPFFQDKKLSYIQTEKRYSRGNFFSDSVDIFDAFFFKFIQPARALNNTAVFAGSCGLIRRSALDDIGGFPEYVIEDTFFSFESDMHNYKSLYMPHVYALGRPIKTFTDLVRQQWRYNYGDTQFIGYFFKRKGFKKGSPLSNMDYIAHGFGLNYLSVILIMFTLISIGIVFSNVPFAHIKIAELLTHNTLSWDLEILGFFAFSLSLLTPVLLTKIYFKSWSKGLMVFFLNYALAFVRTKAALATFINKNPGLNWNRLKPKGSNSILAQLYNTKTEVVFASAMFVLAYIALSETNIAGGIWLMWYGVLYMLATIFLIKYG
jgi:cellulose synthase/poly-beta-1,6-N-acetylglucosamine synthase-like glycosyltransferase